MHEETKLFWCYVASVCFFAVSLIATSVSWSHWAYTINICPSYNCECILYGKALSDRFSGGETVYCQLVTFLQIPIFLTGKTCYSRKERAKETDTAKQEWRKDQEPNSCSEVEVIQNQTTLPAELLTIKTNIDTVLISNLISRDGRTLHEGDVLVEEKTVEMEPPSYCASVTIFVISLLCLLLVITVFLIFTIGFAISCKEYRKVLINLIKASGNMAQVISERLSCLSIFDYMDYLQPKRRIYDSYDDGRRILINTGATLLVGEMALISNIICWFYITIVQGWILRKRIRFDRRFSAERTRE